MQIQKLSKILACFLIAALFLFLLIERNNKLTALRIEVPEMKRNLQTALQENERLSFEIEQFENPLHLMELSRRPEFRHLEFPKLDRVIMVYISSSEKAVE